MDLSSAQWVQMNAAAVIAVLSFIFIYFSPAKFVVVTLILIIPFQIIGSKYGSLTIYLIYLVAFVWSLRNQFREFPFIGYVGFIFFAYALSLSQVSSITLKDHLFYLFLIGSDFLVFYIAYNYFRKNMDVRHFLYLFLIMNGLVLLYSIAQLVVGLDENSPLVGGEIGLRPAREDGRLSGPFGTVGLTAEYMVIAVFITGYALWTLKFSPLLRLMLFFMIMGNFSMMIATGNRGGIFTLVCGSILFLFLFRKEMGGRGVLLSLGGAGVAFALSSILIINYTDFNKLFDRLAQTKIEEGVPDSRSKAWPQTLENIQKKPIVGHGPQLKLSDKTYLQPSAPKPVMWPHNLYLFLAYTLGFIGLIAYLAFLMRIAWSFHEGMSRTPRGSLVEDGFARLAIIVMTVFLIDQIKVEFLRSESTEYQHFIFMIWGALVALASKNFLVPSETNNHISKLVTR